jgi:hypothetical protein
MTPNIFSFKDSLTIPKYKKVFSLLASEGVIIDSRIDPRSRISLPRLIIIFIINQGNNEQPSLSNERFSLISLVIVDDFHSNR